MLSLLTSGLAFVATTTHQIAPTPHHHHVRAVSAPSMGLFDGFKEAFENKVPAADTNAAGKSKKVDGYVKKKMENYLGNIFDQGAVNRGKNAHTACLPRSLHAHLG